MLKNKLSKLAANGGLTQAEADSLNYRLPPQQERLFLYLATHDKANTTELQRSCSITNISETAKKLNKKLSANGDTRKVVCTMQPNINRYNEKGFIGYWTLACGSGR